ncbi:MAG: O-antigen ligase family protein [Gaiellales bacterium]
MGDDVPRTTMVWTSALAGAATLVVALAIFHGGASSSDTLLVVGAVVAAIVVVLAVLAGLGSIPLVGPSRAGWLVCGGLGALTLWAGASIVWSITPDVSWNWLNRFAVYLGIALIGFALGGLRRGPERLVIGLTLVVTAAVAWALLGVVVPSFAPTGDRVARLSEPIGYWNALALVAGICLCCGVALTAVTRAAIRLAGLLLVYGSAVVLLLTQSRGGLIAAAVMLAFVLRRSRAPLLDAVDLTLAAVPGLAVAGWAFTREALVEDGVGRDARIDDGRLFAVALALGAVVVGVAGVRLRRAPVARVAPDRLRRLLAAVAGAVALVAVVGLVAAVGNPVSWTRDQLSAGACENSPDRIGSICDNNRLAWWGEALEIAKANPVAGTGAGTYTVARRRYADSSARAPQPHDVPLQLLADLGLVGLALGVVLVAGAVGASRRALARTGDDAHDRAATILVAVALGYGVHALVDYDADFVAVTAPTLLAVGALAAMSGVPRSRRLGPGVLVAAVAVCLATVGSLALPELATRAVDAGRAALTDGDVGVAARKARDARDLNPLSPEPIVLQGDIADEAGDSKAAAARYREAAELQPENPSGWVALGYYLYLLDQPDYCGAYYAFNAAYTLDPHGPAGVKGGPKDVSLDAVNDGACER